MGGPPCPGGRHDHVWQVSGQAVHRHHPCRRHCALLDQCRERYKVSALYLICYAVVIAGTLDLGNERGKLLGQTIIKNTFAALVDLDAFSLLDD